MLGFIGGDVGYSGKDVGAVSSTAFNTVTMVDATLTSLLIDIKVGEVVVEINRASTEVTAQKSSMSGEDCTNVKMTLLDQRHCYTS